MNISWILNYVSQVLFNILMVDIILGQIVVVFIIKCKLICKETEDFLRNIHLEDVHLLDIIRIVGYFSILKRPHINIL
jgi:hypothetical protein